MAVARALALRPRWWDLVEDLLCVLDAELVLRAVNPAWQGTLGWSEQELIGHSAVDRLHPCDAPVALEALWSDRDRDRFNGIEARCRHADGSWRWLSWSGVREDGLWHCVGRDVTAGKATARELDRRTRRLDALVQALEDGLVFVDGDARILEVNERFIAMTGFTQEDLVGTTPPYAYWPEEHAEAIAAAFRAAVAGRPGHFELTFCRKDGERFPVTVATCALPDDEHGVGGVVGVMREVTQELRERERLREAHRVARLLGWEYDPATGRVELSRELAGAAGLALGPTPTLDELLALTVPGHCERLREAVAAVLAGATDGITLDGEVRPSDRAVRWVETRLQPVRTGTGAVARVRATTQDVTARKVAELAREESEERLRQAQRLAAIGSFELDFESGAMTWSPELQRLFAVDPATFEHQIAGFRSLVPEPDADELARVTNLTLADGRPRGLAHRYRRGEALRWAETRLEAMPAAGSRALRGTIQDITQRKRAEDEIHLQAHLLDAVDVAVIATGLDGMVTHWNRGAERIYGWTRAETLGRPLTELTLSGVDAPTVQEIMADVLRSGQWEGELEVQRNDGTRFPAELRTSRFDAPGGELQGMVGVSVDISDRVEADRRLRAASDVQRAITDSMGEGLYTHDTEGRLLYLNRAGEAMLGWRLEELAGRVMHEVTHFRTPDGALRRPEECPLLRSRTDGEVVRLPDEVLIRKDGTELPVEMTSAPFETEHGVRGSVVVFSDITERKARERELHVQRESMTWVGRVRDALVEDRFVLHAQPIVDVTSRRVVQHELLIRMRTRSGTVLAPGLFLPAAEEFGLIVDIDRWVMHQAVTLAARGHAVELNLSARSIAVPGLADEFGTELRRAGADPALIVVELTETALLEDGPAAERFMERMRSFGTRLALDDFGTGYAGFTYLKRLPFDFLKIDTEFVRDLAENDASRQVVSAVVSLARGFGLKTVAEGVEDLATLDILSQLGVDYAQGYAIARPAPVEETLG